MADSLYLTDEDRKTLEIAGWPEWWRGDRHYVLGHDGAQFFICCTDAEGEQMTKKVDPHVAPCLIRDHLRVWLIERDCFIQQGRWRTWMELSNGELLDDENYDAALIAAVLAVGKDASDG